MAAANPPPPNLPQSAYLYPQVPDRGCFGVFWGVLGYFRGILDIFPDFLPHMLWFGISKPQHVYPKKMWVKVSPEWGRSQIAADRVPRDPRTVPSPSWGGLGWGWELLLRMR